MRRLFLTIVSGAGIALAYTASPLGVCFVLLAPLLCVASGRGLPRDERRVLMAVLATALAMRFLVVLGIFVAAIPRLNDLAVGSLSGDEAYNLARALRARDILRGFANTHYDYFVASDQYGYTSYLELLTRAQYLFGPAPYGFRLVNALMFTAGAAVLFRLVRPAFGALPAFLGLVGVLFLPSVFYASISLLKESLYFLATSTLLAAAVLVFRSRTWTGTVAAATTVAISVWMLDDLRRGAVVLAVAGLATGLALRVSLATARRAFVAAVLVIGLVVATLASPALSSRVRSGIDGAARTHSGHVFTVGHAYKLLDSGFYRNPTTPAASSITLTPSQAARFLLRAGASFVMTPLPWQAVSLSELAFLPEHLLWYLVLLFLPIGIVAGWRRDPLVTAVIVGFVLPTAAALALTNGNVGTLLRLRGLVTPYLMWLSTLGAAVCAEGLLAARRQRPAAVATGGPSKGLGDGVD